MDASDFITASTYPKRISFDYLCRELEEMKETARDWQWGDVSVKTKGRELPVQIAVVEPGKDLEKMFKTCNAGILILRENYCELVYYENILSVIARIHTGKAPQ